MSSAGIDCEVCVVGAGPVGLALALAAARAGLAVALVEGREPRPPERAGWDLRVYAVSPGSRELVRSLGAWQAIPAERIEPIAAMRVWGDGGAEIGFDALDSGAADLGAIVEAGELQWALWCRALAEPAIRRLVPASCRSLVREPGELSLALAGGETVSAALFVAADGADSWLRRAAGIGATARSYGQRGVVANFACERPHDGVARQWFRSDGVLAWLPLHGRRISMVWSTPAAHADELIAAEEASFCRRVAEAGGEALGRLELLGARAAFPLQVVVPERAVAPGIALVGDAAHVIHPLAGQGVNVGLRDARVLGEVLAAREAFQPPGDLALLRRYERARSEDWMATRWVTDGLNSLFAAADPALRRVRNAGLGVTDRLAWVKRQLMAHAMQ